MVEKIRHYVPYFGGGSGTNCDELAEVMLRSASDLVRLTIDGISDQVHNFDIEEIETIYD